MAYFLSFIAEGEDAQPVDGDEVATSAGLAAFQEWAAALDESYPELGYLGEYGECHPADAIGQLESDLERALREKPNEPSDDVSHVARSLLEGVRRRPDDADALVVTDGTGA